MMLFSWRERQLKLEKVRATQQHIEEFKRQQAEWRRMEQEQMEAENRRIMEFASHQQHMEETRMAKMREKDEAKEHLRKKVENFFFFFLKPTYFYLFIQWHESVLVSEMTPLCPLAVWENWRGAAAAWRDGTSPWGTLLRRTRRGKQAKRYCK